MRPGMGHVLVGVALLAAGLGVTLMSKEVVWYGAIVVGVIEIARGAYAGVKGRRDGDGEANGGDTHGADR